MAETGPLPHDHQRKVSQREHVLLRPGLYVGSLRRDARPEWLLDLTSMRMVKATTEIPLGMERVFLEVLSNATDANHKAQLAGLPMSAITVNMDDTTVEVINEGWRVQVEVDPKEQIYIPEMIFGQMLSGSNFDENQDRVGCGTYGIGVKATNVFSKEFAVEIGDPETHQLYTQRWSGNMAIKEAPVIAPYDEDSPYVRVIYTLDFKRFGYEAGAYPPDAASLFAKHAADMAFATKNCIAFNGVSLSFEGADYAKLYFPPEVADTALYFEREDDEEGYCFSAVALDTPDKAEILSFVNGLTTRKGGVHVETFVKLISDEVLAKFKAGGRASDARARSDPKARLTLADVRPHLSVLVSYQVRNPEYEGQTKETLTHPKPTKQMKFTNKEARAFAHWNLMDRLAAALMAKDYRKLSSTDGKKKQHIGPTPGVQANFAGTKRSHECTLLVVEGKSAEGYASTAIDNIVGGHDLVGVFPLKGKPLNVTNATTTKLLGNDEIARLKKVLGLREAVGPSGCDYAQDKEYLTLRYGRVVIMADADDDGRHITALVINLFYNFYRGLLQRGCIFFFRSPIIRVKRGGKKLSFFTESEYKSWQGATPDSHLWEAKYFKGLGSSNGEDIAEDFVEPHYVECFYDDAAPEMLKLVFDGKMADERKESMAKWKPFFGSEELVKQPISVFIDRELSLYALRSLERAIPALMDGQKDSQRKILEGARWHWGTKEGLWRAGGSHHATKVTVFASEVAARTKYRHGPTSMEEAIVGMAATFVGNQNLPFFVEDGNFGTRNQGGKDHANARYLSTYPQTWLPYVFRNEDFPVLRLNEDEGEKIEPHRFLPVVPLAVINGATGVATGWSTLIPCHSPKAVVEWLRARIEGRKTPKLIPWYRGFSGEIAMEHLAAKVTKGEQDDFGPEEAREAEVDPLERAATTAEPEAAPVLAEGDEGVQDGELSMVTKGRFAVEIIDGKRKRCKGELTKVVITELPLRYWSDVYYQKLEKLAESGAIDFLDHRTTTTVNFEITGFENPSVEKLGLKKAFGLSNMILLSEEGLPRRYANVNEIMEDFYANRLPWYDRRKAYYLGELELALARASAKIAFIEAVNAGRIVIKDRPSGETEAEMVKMGLPPELLSHVILSSLSPNKLEELKEERNALSAKRDAYGRKSAGTLWLDDLADFEKAYDGWIASFERGEAKKAKMKNRRVAGDGGAAKKASQQ